MATENDGSQAAGEGTAASAEPAAAEATVTGINEAGEQVTEGAEPAAGEEAAAAAEGESEEEAAADEGEGDAKPKKRPWWQKRIDELTREKHEAARRAAQAEARLAQPAAGEEEAEAPDVARLTEAEIERRAEAKAATRAAEKSFADACNGVYDKGVEAHGEDAWKDALGTFQTLVGDQFRAVTSIALATDDPAKVIHELGSNPDEAERILALPPARMAIEMDRLARGRKQAKPVSKAPAPIRPVSGPGSSTDPLADDAPMDKFAPAFMERFQRHLNS